MSDLPAGGEVIAAFSNLIIATAAGAGAIAAWAGLYTWKKQISWQSDRELARLLMASIFRFRDAIAGVRAPAIYSHEYMKDGKLIETGKGPEIDEFVGLEFAYSQRWERVVKANEEISELLLEAEALWGEEIPRTTEKLQTLALTYFRTLQLTLEAKKPSKDLEDRRAASKLLKTKKYTLTNFQNEDDRFGNDLTAIIEHIKFLVLPKIGRQT